MLTTVTVVAIIVIMLISACFSEVATASRQIWSFARDQGEYIPMRSLPSCASHTRTNQSVRLPILELALQSHTRLEHPSPCRLRLPSRDMPSSSHQHRIRPSTQRNQFLSISRATVLILHHNWMSRMASPLWRTSTCSAVDIRTIWLSDQYCGVVFSDPAVLLLRVAIGAAGDGGEYVSSMCRSSWHFKIS